MCVCVVSDDDINLNIYTQPANRKRDRAVCRAIIITNRFCRRGSWSKSDSILREYSRYTRTISTHLQWWKHLRQHKKNILTELDQQELKLLDGILEVLIVEHQHVLLVLEFGGRGHGGHQQAHGEQELHGVAVVCWFVCVMILSTRDDDWMESRALLGSVPMLGRFAIN